MSKKRLLIITNRYPSGPHDIASPFVRDFHEALRKQGIDIDIVTPYYKPFRNDTRYIDDSVHLFQWSDGNRVISQLPLYNPVSYSKIVKYFRNGYKTAEKIMRERNFTAILALWALPSGYIANRLSEKYGIPYGVWALGSDINSWAHFPVLGSLTSKVLRGAHALFADGYELALKVQALSARECRFIPSFHNLDFGRGIFEEEQNVFLTVGRIEREKGVFDLLEAFRLFAQKIHGWQLYYAGSGRAEIKLWKKVVDYGLADSVECYGHLEQKAVNHLLSLSTAVIIPSHSDSLPLTFGEAMQAGKPVITSEIGDMPHFVDKYQVGYHYPVGDIVALAGKMEMMTSNRDNFSLNCRKVLAELDIDNSAQVVSAWLDTLIGPNIGVKHEYARS